METKVAHLYCAMCGVKIKSTITNHYRHEHRDSLWYQREKLSGYEPLTGEIDDDGNYL